MTTKLKKIYDDYKEDNHVCDYADMIQDFIDKAIDSILKQDIGNYDLEIIIVDGNSTDKTRDIVKNLHAMGLKLVMLTGDSKGAAKVAAEELGIKEFYGDLTPGDKSTFVKRMKEQQIKTAMVGDGVNDAPALTEADVGIAMGKGSDIAIESADITLLKGDISGIEKAFRISRYTLRNIRQNLFFAFFYNVLSIPIAAGILYPFYGFLLNPMIACLVMSMSSLSVVINSLRLRKVRL